MHIGGTDSTIVRQNVHTMGNSTGPGDKDTHHD